MRRGDRRSNGQQPGYVTRARRRPAGGYLAQARRAVRAIPAAADTARVPCALCGQGVDAARSDGDTWLTVLDRALRRHLHRDCPETTR